MQLLNPTWLWALTGILIPIGIHLLSRKVGSTVRVGSVRHLEDTQTKQFKSLRLNELLLLALRCSLIILLALFLSALHLNGLEKEAVRWVLVEKGLEGDRRISSLVDSLRQQKFAVKELAPGFPAFKGRVVNKPGNYWARLEELEAQSLDQAVVLSYSYAAGFSGLRRRLPENVKWISENPGAVEFTLQALATSKDSVLLRTGKTNAEATQFETLQIAAYDSERYLNAGSPDSISVAPVDTISIAVKSDRDFKHDKEILLTALAVLKELTPYAFNVDTTTLDTTALKKKDWIVWLSKEPIPSHTSRTIAYQINENINTRNLFERTSDIDNVAWALTKRLNKATAIEDNLTAQLAVILLPRDKQKIRTQSFDRRVLPEKISWRKDRLPASETVRTASIVSAEKIIAILFFVIFMVERFISFKRDS